MRIAHIGFLATHGTEIRSDGAVLEFETNDQGNVKWRSPAMSQASWTPVQDEDEVEAIRARFYGSEKARPILW